MGRQAFKIIGRLLAALFLAGLLVLLLFSLSLLGTGERKVGPVETIQGIPYARGAAGIHIDEAMAHADIYLGQPVIGKKLILTLEFIPTTISGLSVGVRENSFWLSYEKNQLYSGAPDQEAKNVQISVPLTDKLQEGDQSIDLMFFAEGHDPDWQLVSLKAEVAYARPTWAQFKNYAKAIIYRERAL